MLITSLVGLLVEASVNSVFFRVKSMAKPPKKVPVPGSSDLRDSSNTNTPGRPDTTLDHLPWRPGISPGHEPDLPLLQPILEHTPVPDAQPAAIEITDLPASTHISRITTDHPISHYYLPPKMVERLPAPDPQTGFRSISSGRKFVDLVDGGTVLLESDAQGHLRAKQLSELVPSGPRLERVEGTLEWRQVPADSIRTGDSELIISRHPAQAGGQEEAGPSKRPRIPEAPASSEPWKNWGIAAHHASPEDVTIEGVHYKTVSRADAPDHPIVYIKNPAHLIYDFDLFQRTLGQHVEQQPRGAIQVPPTHHWTVDPTLPFERTLTNYVVTYFPELSDLCALNVARKQFSLANGSDIATGAGLTTLRQAHNDWKTSSITPRPELVDPLLMLSVLPTVPGKGTYRIVELPDSADEVSLQRLEFDTQKFLREWKYFTSTLAAGDYKRFMKGLLTRNGYTVFEPGPAHTFPTLVFTRTGHDFVFYMTLHRIHGRKVQISPTDQRRYAPERLPELIGLPALRAVQNAEAANKLIWLKGGGQFRGDHPDSVFIVRTDDPRL
ncbi:MULTISPECIES: hypothetical protein [unclassified Pseudomonas]|jgi:hypothetical protein|uniref:hypothetical protein n=1 Tax=Pseudomonas sp. A-R-26 TaxID=2832404 RepID=UPI001CC092A5|nr:hypothetical protein [Pseudomonas sp. A-R-26]